MSESSWLHFRALADRVVRGAFGFHLVEPEGWEVMLGAGEWQGVSEESFRVAGFGLSESDAESVAETLRDRVSVLAELFGQDAIAVTVGRSSLVS